MDAPVKQVPSSQHCKPLKIIFCENSALPLTSTRSTGDSRAAGPGSDPEAGPLAGQPGDRAVPVRGAELRELGPAQNLPQLCVLSFTAHFHQFQTV